MSGLDESPPTVASFRFLGSMRIPMGQYCGNQTSGTSIYNPFPESLIRFTVFLILQYIVYRFSMNSSLNLQGFFKGFHRNSLKKLFLLEKLFCYV